MPTPTTTAIATPKTAVRTRDRMKRALTTTNVASTHTVSTP